MEEKEALRRTVRRATDPRVFAASYLLAVAAVDEAAIVGKEPARGDDARRRTVSAGAIGARAADQCANVLCAGET